MGFEDLPAAETQLNGSLARTRPGVMDFERSESIRTLARTCPGDMDSGRVVSRVFGANRAHACSSVMDSGIT